MTAPQTDREQEMQAAATVAAPPTREHGIGCAHVHTYLGEICPGAPAPSRKQAQEETR